MHAFVTPGYTLACLIRRTKDSNRNNTRYQGMLPNTRESVLMSMGIIYTKGAWGWDMDSTIIGIRNLKINNTNI